MATRIGVDIGGTFTDLVYYDDETGETVEGKVPTVPHAPEEGVVAAVRGHVPPAVIEKARRIVGDGPTYVSFDIDSLDPSFAPGTGTPSHGGFLYYEVMEMLQGLVKRGDVVGIDLVEVAPAYDPSGITGFLAAQVLLNFLGYIFVEREARGR